MRYSHVMAVSMISILIPLDRRGVRGANRTRETSEENVEWNMKFMNAGLLFDYVRKLTKYDRCTHLLPFYFRLRDAL